MSLSGKRKWFRKWHKWPSLFLAIFILLFALSGIILNHRSWFRQVDLARKLLPAEYRYQNWNLAAVRGALELGHDSLLIFGNTGIWLTNRDFSRFTGFNEGFPEGIDNRKVSSMARTDQGDLFAGSLFGLFRRPGNAKSWEKVPLPVGEERITKVLVLRDSLWVLTRSLLLIRDLSDPRSEFVAGVLPPAADDDGRASLFRTLWVVHSGEIYGHFGRLLVDFAGLVFIFLTFTGLVYFFTPLLLERLKEEARHRLKRFNRWSLRWHNRAGSWLIALLVLTTLTGIFLRPPLLLPIAGARVGKIPFSLLDSPNPWYDKLRDVVVDDSTGRILLSTSEGMYYSDDRLRSALKPFRVQPPISVMGINVFEKIEQDTYLVGSFSGLYYWMPGRGTVIDYSTGQPVDPGQMAGQPFGELSVAGLVRVAGGRDILFDYARGALVGSFPAMPEEMLAASPMSLWNVALEFHTCRIYGTLIGNFYILLIPLFGLGILFVLVTGFFSWYLGWLAKQRKTLRESPVTA